MYFAVDLNSSTYNEGLFQGGAYETIGPYSPLRFNVILDYPLSLFTSYTRSTFGTEFGIWSETDIDCLFVVYNDVKLTPSLFDLVVIAWNDTLIEPERYKPFLPVWKVGNLEKLPIETEEMFYKIKLVGAGKKLSDIQKAWDYQIVETYKFDELTKRIYKLSDFELLSRLRLYEFKAIDELNKQLSDNYISALSAYCLET